MSFYVKDLEEGSEVHVYTQNSHYVLILGELHGESRYATISGGWFKEPEKVFISGSTWGAAAIKVGFIGVEMQLEVWRCREDVHPYDRSLTMTETARIEVGDKLVSLGELAVQVLRMAHAD